MEFRWHILSLSAKKVFKNKNENSQTQYRVWNSVGISVQTFLALSTQGVSKNKCLQTQCRVWQSLVSIQTLSLSMYNFSKQKQTFTVSVSRMELRWHINRNLSGAEYAGRFPKQKFFKERSAKEVFKNKTKSSQIQYRVWNSVGISIHSVLSLSAKKVFANKQKQKFTNSVSHMELRWHINRNLSGAEYAGRFPKQKFFKERSAKEVFKNKTKSSQIQYRVWNSVGISIRSVLSLSAKKVFANKQKQKFTNSVSHMELRWHINTNLLVVEFSGRLKKIKLKKNHKLSVAYGSSWYQDKSCR